MFMRNFIELYEIMIKSKRIHASHPSWSVPKRIKTIILYSVVFTLLLIGCDDGSRMGYVFEIIENGNGECTYHLSYSPGGKTNDFTMVTACGHYKIGEKIPIPK